MISFSKITVQLVILVKKRTEKEKKSLKLNLQIEQRQLVYVDILAMLIKFADVQDTLDVNKSFRVYHKFEMSL